MEFLEDRRLLASWSGDIPNGTIWPTGVVQQVAGNIHVPAGATLTVQPGAIIKFNYGDNNLTVDGSLTAQGTVGQPIIFTSFADDSAGGDTNNSGASNGSNGEWGTIQFNAGSTNNLLDHVEVRYGGGWSTNALVTDKGAPLTLTNSVLRNSYTNGIRIEGASPTLTNNTWTNHFGAAVSMDLAASPAISGVTISNNGINGAYLDGGSLTVDNAWDDPDIVYWVGSNTTVPVGKTLTVSPGQVVKFPYGDRNLIVNGTLRATGAVAKPIIFTSFADDSAGGDTNNSGASNGSNGEWGTIQFNAGSTNNLLDHVEVRYGGGWSTNALVTDKGAPLTLTNSVLRNSYTNGIRIEGASPTLTNNTWTNHFGAAVSMDLAASPAISGVTISNNGINGAYLDGGSLTVDNAWDDPDIVYWVGSNTTVPVGKTLTVSPGQVVKFPYGDRNLIVNGTLRATGAVAKPIIFTSFADDSAGGDTNNSGASNGSNGEWGTIQFNAGSTNNLLNHVEVRYGGGWSSTATVTASNTSLRVQHSIIRNSYTSALLATARASVSVSSSLLVNNYQTGLRAESGATISATNNTIDGNGRGAAVDGAASLLRLTNNLISNHALSGVSSANRGSASLAYNDVYNPSAGQANYSGLSPATGTNGNVSVDPKYLNREAGDYHLQDSSPMIDAGTSAGAPVGDLAFNSQIDQPETPNSGGGTSPYFDVGAYEFGGRPLAVEHEPVGANVGPIGSALFTFRGAMDTTSFSLPGNVVSFVGPNGVIAPYAFRWRNPYQLQIDFPPQGRAGNYSLTIGPNILDVAGHAMDHNGDGVFGTIPGDQYKATWTVTPPRIVQQTPNNFVNTAIDQFTFTFDRPMDATSFDLADDIVKFTGPGGNLVATGFTWTDPKTLTVSFASQNTLGFYEMVLSPQIADASGNTLDQDGNLSGGESPADQYRATATRANIIFASGAITQNTTWTGLVVVQDHVTVNPGVTLTIAPGTIVKFADATTLTVSAGATISANGTASQPIYFTSLHDDSVGGDADQNGNLVGPSAGDWGQVNNKGTANFDHVRVLYGSGIGNTGLNSGAIRNESGTMTFANSAISQAFYDGLDAVGGTIAMSNSFVIGADRGVVATLNGATITIVNSTIDDNRIGIFAHAGGAISVKNSIVSNSLETGILTDSGPIPITYSDVWSKVANAVRYSGMSDQTGQLGNLSVDPKFTAQADGNYRLAFRSPLIDAADGPAAPATDYFGRPRYDDPRSTNTGTLTGGGVYADMGPIEFVEGAASPVDLAASAVGAPTAAVQGDQIAVQWTVLNVGTDVARGTWSDGIYFSTDALWSTDDVLAASKLHQGNLGVNQSYQGSVEFSVPALPPGSYYLLVRANFDNSVFEGQNLANNTATSAPIIVDVPELLIGAPLPGSLATSGDVRAYKLVVPAGQDVVVSLTGAGGSLHEIYARLGNVPSLQEFDQHSPLGGQTSPTLVIPSAQAGTNYVLVRAANLATPETFTLTATTLGFAISNVEPAKGDNNGSVTLTFHGAKFSETAQPQLVDSTGQTINATSIYFTNSTTVSATFDLRGHAAGPAVAKITVAGTGSTQLAGAFQIVTGSPGTLSAHIVAPSRIRLARDYSVVVEYTNTGDSDLLAPIMRLQNGGTSPLSFDHDFSRNLSSLDLVGVNDSGPAGILPPGAHGRIEVFAHSTAPGNGTDSFSLMVGNYPATPINWDGMSSLIRPLSLDDASWNLLFGRLKANIGVNWSDYQTAISKDAILLTSAQGLNYSLRDVLQLEYDKAYSELNQSLAGRLVQQGTLNPIGGAKITLTEATASDSLDEALVTESFDAISLSDGSFTVQSIIPGTYNISVDGYVLSGTTQITVGSTDVTGLTLVANAAGRISGSVILSPEGAPQPNALVFASSDVSNGFSTYADENGNYSFDSLPPGIYQVFTPAGQYTKASVTDLSIAVGTVKSHVNLTVGIGGTLQGKVTGPGGVVNGATVTAVDIDGIGISATTSSTGEYTITGLIVGSYTVLTTAAGFARAEVDNVVLPAGGAVGNVNFALGSAGAIAGTVTQSVGGSPIGSVLVSASNATAVYSAMSAPDGTYTIAGVPPGNYEVSIQDDALMTVTSNATVAANGTTQLPLAVVPRGTVSGKVTNSINGSPIAHVVVHASMSRFVTSAVTDAAGNYQLTGLDGGTYLVGLSDASSPGIIRSQVVISPATPAATANFSVAVAGIISGTTFAADGTTPLPGIVVGLVEGTTPVQSMITDDQGHYSFVLVAAGTYQVEAGGEGLAFPTRPNLVVSGGATLSGQNFVAGHETLTGVVKDATTGQPLEGAVLRVSRIDGIVSATSVGGFVTEANGAFEVTGAIAGIYRVTALLDGYAVGIQSVTITSGALATLDVPLVKEGVIHGVVRDVNTNLPIGDVAITVTSSSGTAFSFSLLTDATGNYEIHQLPAGSYTMTAIASGHAASIVQNIVLAAQQNFTQDVALGGAAGSVQGMVTNAAGPVAGVGIAALNANGFVVGNATTADDGSYRLTTLAAGTYTLAAFAPGYRAAEQVDVIVPSGGLQGANFAIVALALIDPPEGEGAGATSSNSGVADLFADPSKARTATHRPSATFNCADGTVLNDQAGADAVLGAFKQWQDLFDATSNIRNQAPKVLAEADAKLTNLRATYSSLKTKLSETNDFINIGGGIFDAVTNLRDKLKPPTTKEIEAEKAKKKQIEEIQKGLTKATTFLEGVIQNIDGMSSNLATARNSADRTAAIGAMLHLLKTADSVGLVSLALGLGALIAPEMLPPKLQKYASQIESIKLAVHEVSDAGTEFLRSVNDLEKLNRVTFLLEVAKANYDDVFDEVRQRRLAMKAKCPCSSATPGNSGNSTLPAPGTTPGAEGESSPIFQVCRKSDEPKEPIGPPDNRQPPPPNAPPSTTTVSTTETAKPVSGDPNHKIGPTGVGANHAVPAVTLPYLVEFENAASVGATVPAQEVFVTDELDMNLDLATLEFTSFGFGSHKFSVPAGLSNYSTTIDLRPSGTNLLVTVDLTVNPATRVVSAVYRSLAPLTLLLPDDPDAGFLPVNDATHRGEGFFTYQIRPVPGIASGTVIRNQASIVFDTNDPIVTPAVTNAIDVNAPVSSVVLLSPKQNDQFMVKWAGADDASGIQKFDVFVSDNNGLFFPWQVATSATSALYTGAIPGHTYAFYVVATDKVGHVELSPSSADTQTHISDNPWQNAENRLDADHDTFVVASDVLAVINYINASKSGSLPATRPADKNFVDVNGDTNVAADDVLEIINHINANPNLQGESTVSPVPPFFPTRGTLPIENDQRLPSDLLSLIAFDIVSQSKRRK